MRVLARAIVGGLLGVSGAWGAAFDYRLEPVEVASDTYVFVGRSEDASATNGGNVVNSAFIVTREGVVVIDTGPTQQYAEQVRAAIRRVTVRPIVRVLNTHHHGAHVLGNKAYGDLAEAAPSTIEAMRRDGAAGAAEMLLAAGEAAVGTELQVPTKTARPGRFRLGDHELELIIARGHTDADLVLVDHTTATVFAGDLVFSGRAPTFENADMDEWIDALSALDAIRFRMLVPGHGAPSRNAVPIRETRDYLLWLSGRLEKAAAEGLEMREVMAVPPPERFRRLILIESEYPRTVQQLYPALERLQRARPAAPR